jgi:hypothetical protein
VAGGERRSIIEYRRDIDHDGEAEVTPDSNDNPGTGRPSELELND